MKIWPDCIPCILKMALEVMRTVTRDERLLGRFLAEILEFKPLRGENYSITSPELTRDVWLKIKRFSGMEDPLKTKKEAQNRMALDIYPCAKEIIDRKSDPVGEALKLSILGNSIDSMVGMGGFSGEEFVKLLQESRINAKAVEGLKEKIFKAQKIIYLGDNCGEIVFDKLFIETLRKFSDTEMIYITRTLPILNDALLEDAVSVGMNETVRVMENGIPEPFPGTTIGKVSEEVRNLMEDSNLVISKGIGNYDSLSEEEHLRGKVSFLLRGKCYPTCAVHGVSLGSLIVSHFD
jgi:uncharacterized protein with ATP-grasp and redox domains